MNRARLFTAIVAGELRIPFKVAFRHASAARSETASLWVTAHTAHGVGAGESCPRPYVTGETVEGSRKFCQRHIPALVSHVSRLPDLHAWMRAHREEIDAHPAAWCALELAILDALARQQQMTVESLLDLPPLPASFRYSAVLGDSDPAAFAKMARRYRDLGFTDVKIKLSGDLERDRAKAAALREWPSLRVRADANNLWESAPAAIAFLTALELPIWAIEEPVGATRYDELLAVADALDCRIILDESLVRAAQLDALPASSSRWVVNVRVSKMGGVLRSLDVVHAARRRHLGLIVGAQVGETSVLTRAALPVASAAGDRLLAQEGAFGTELLAEDVADPPLMFGRGGVLDLAGSSVRTNPGFGLDIGARWIPDIRQ
jgi:L-alanine-DL-glutamate epimerase-like enolase superfamily enzyme